VGSVADRRGLHARITPPERWKRMSSYQKQKAVRSSMLRKVSSSLHMPQRTFLETYMSPLGIVIDRDPLTYAREFSLDADELDLFLHDRARAASVTRTLAAEEKAEVTKKERETKSRRKQEVCEKMRQKELPAKSEEPALPGPPAEKSSQKSQKTLFEGF